MYGHTDWRSTTTNDSQNNECVVTKISGD